MFRNGKLTRRTCQATQSHDNHNCDIKDQKDKTARDNEEWDTWDNKGGEWNVVKLDASQTSRSHIFESRRAIFLEDYWTDWFQAFHISLIHICPGHIPEFPDILNLISFCYVKIWFFGRKTHLHFATFYQFSIFVKFKVYVLDTCVRKVYGKFKANGFNSLREIWHSDVEDTISREKRLQFYRHNVSFFNIPLSFPGRNFVQFF